MERRLQRHFESRIWMTYKWWVDRTEINKQQDPTPLYFFNFIFLFSFLDLIFFIFCSLLLQYVTLLLLLGEISNKNAKYLSLIFDNMSVLIFIMLFIISYYSYKSVFSIILFVILFRFVTCTFKLLIYLPQRINIHKTGILWK